MSGVDIAGLVERLRSLADCDSRAGEPLGKCMRRAADALLAQAAELAEARPYREELLKIAADVGEPDDPFAAWEVVQALTRQRDEALAALKASEEREAKLIRKLASARCPHETFSDEAVERAARAMIAQTEGITHGKFDLLSRDVQEMWLAMARVALRAGLADATNNPPSDPGTEQREAGAGPSPASAPCPHAPTYDAGLCCGHPDDCTFVSPSNLLKEKDDA